MPLRGVQAAQRPLVAVTMTLVRTEQEHELILRALATLSAFDIPIILTDGGSYPEFVAELRGLRHVQVHVPAHGSGLVSQVATSLQLAATHRGAMLLYTEPDKADFFAHGLGSFLDEALDRVGDRSGSDLRPDATRPAVVLAARDERSWSTFPAFQQDTEGALNRMCGELTGLPGDYCFGPFLFNAALVPYIVDLPGDLGWGWRPFTVLLARRLGHALGMIPGEHACPFDQRHDDRRERLHRMRQLEQNVRGLLLAEAHPLELRLLP